MKKYYPRVISKTRRYSISVALTLVSKTTSSLGVVALKPSEIISKVLDTIIDSRSS